MDNTKKMTDYEIAVERRLEKSCERDGWIASAHVAFGGDAGSVRPAASLALPVADVPGQELDYVLARVAERLAYLVEDAGPLRLPGIAVGAALFSDVFRL